MHSIQDRFCPRWVLSLCSESLACPIWSCNSCLTKFSQPTGGAIWNPMKEGIHNPWPSGKISPSSSSDCSFSTDGVFQKFSSSTASFSLAHNWGSSWGVAISSTSTPPMKRSLEVRNLVILASSLCLFSAIAVLCVAEGAVGKSWISDHKASLQNVSHHEFNVNMWEILTAPLLCLSLLPTRELSHSFLGGKGLTPSAAVWFLPR